MPFKFERLEVWQLALDYVDGVYELAEQLPPQERYNLRSQFTRAATSIALNIAEGSTGQTDAEQARFLGLAIRSLLETVACQHLISRREYLDDPQPLRELYRKSEVLVAKLHTMRQTIAPDKPWIREPMVEYKTGNENGNEDEDERGLPF
jgi:four helix bundle protein